MDQISTQISEAIRRQRGAIAQALVRREFARRPGLEERFGLIGREKCLEDACYHLSFHAEAVGAGEPALFVDYIRWVKVMLCRRGMPASDLVAHLKTMEEVLAEMLPEEFRPPVLLILGQALGQVAQFPEDLPRFVGGQSPALAQEYLQALLGGQRHAASELILDAVDRGVGVKSIYLEVFQPSQYEIGRLWQTNQINVAQEHYCTAATQLIMSQLYPRIFSGEKKPVTFVGACVGGDLHEIGMRMITDFLEMSGWNTWYLGANTPSASVAQIVGSCHADLLGISATITYHVHEVETLIRSIRSDRAVAGVRILVGGYPFNLAPDLWKWIGADGSVRDAGDVVSLSEALIK